MFHHRSSGRFTSYKEFLKVSSVHLFLNKENKNNVSSLNKFAHARTHTHTHTTHTHTYVCDVCVCQVETNIYTYVCGGVSVCVGLRVFMCVCVVYFSLVY